MKIDKYYICHYSKLSERRVYVENHIKQYKLDTKWVLEYDKEEITSEVLDKFPKILDYNTNIGRKLSMSEISLVLKHFHIFNDMIKNNYNNIVVFEDDIILVEDFNKKIESYTNQLDNDYDILWIGTCCNLHTLKTSNDINVYRCERGSRCTHAYVISRKACEKIIQVLDSINEPIDWFFNKIIKQLNLNNYWAEPELSIQDLSFNSAINCGTVL